MHQYYYFGWVAHRARTLIFRQIIFLVVIHWNHALWNLKLSDLNKEIMGNLERKLTWFMMVCNDILWKLLYLLHQKSLIWKSFNFGALYKLCKNNRCF
jgi:hypothetical protein